jgi:hypothetical protein
MTKNIYYTAEQKQFFQVVSEQDDNFSVFYFHYDTPPFEGTLTKDEFKRRSFRSKKYPELNNLNFDVIKYSFSLLIDESILKPETLESLNNDESFIKIENLNENEILLIDPNDKSLYFEYYTNKKFHNIKELSNYFVSQRILPVHIMTPQKLRDIETKLIRNHQPIPSKSKLKNKT